jgi:hypothetical protein
MPYLQTRTLGAVADHPKIDKPSLPGTRVTVKHSPELASADPVVCA